MNIMKNKYGILTINESDKIRSKRYTESNSHSSMFQGVHAFMEGGYLCLALFYTYMIENVRDKS